MNQLYSLLFALRFLTRLPVGGLDQSFDPAQAAASPPWFASVGLLLGFIIATTAWLLLEQLALPASLVAALTVMLWIGLTGALHLDGLADCADAWMCCSTPERMLEVMQDSRCGVAAVVVIVMTLVIKIIAVSALLEQQQWMLLILPVVMGRIMMVFALLLLPYLRQNGLGQAMKTGANTIYSIAGSLVVFILLLAVLPAATLVAVLFATIGALLVWLIFCRQLGGATGDVYGAVCEVAEVCALLGVVLFFT